MTKQSNGSSVRTGSSRVTGAAVEPGAVRAWCWRGGAGAAAEGFPADCKRVTELGPDGPQRPPVVTSENITATVYYKPQLEGSYPVPINVTEGDPVQLNCLAVGNPSPSYNWTLPLVAKERSSLPAGSTLSIVPVTSKDEGLYTCSVSNDAGTVTVKFDVHVQGLKSTSTRLPPTTTTSTTTTTQTTTVPNCGTSSILLHRSMCFVLLFSALV